MGFEKGEIKIRKQNEIYPSISNNRLENVRSMVERNEVLFSSSNAMNEELSSRKIVSEAWHESINEYFGNHGIRYVEKYITENYQLLISDIKENLPRFNLFDISEICKNLHIKDMVQTVTYFCMWKLNIAMTELGYLGEIADTETLSTGKFGSINIAKEISSFYKNVITPDYIKKYYEGADLPEIKVLISEISQITEEAVISACYLGSKLILGIGEVVEDAVDYAVAGISCLAGKKQIAESVYSRSFTRELAKEIENNFNGNVHIKDAGRLAEQCGTMGAYVALSIFATGGCALGAVPVTVVVGANVVLGLAKASDVTRKIAEITGEVDSKELLCGLGAGILKVVCSQTTSWINGKIDTACSKAIREIQQSGGKNAGAKIILKELEQEAIRGAVESGIFSLQDVYEDILLKAVDAEDNNISWKKILRDVGLDVIESAAWEIIFCLGSKVFKFVTDMKDYGGNLSWKERIQIKLETGWDNSIIKCIENMEQYDIYINAGLHQEEICGRLSLCKEIDMDYVSKKTIDDKNPRGMTNRELMENGRVPYDSKSGERIELHHMGQEYDSPFAELLENSEHGDGKHKILHDKDTESWRRNLRLKNAYNNIDRPKHWQERIKTV